MRKETTHAQGWMGWVFFFFFFPCRFYFSLKPPSEPSAQTTPPGVQTQQKDTAIFSLLADSLPVSMGEWPGIAHLSGGGHRLYGFALWHPRACVCDGTPGSAPSEGLHSLRGPAEAPPLGVKKETLDSFQRSTEPVNQGASRGQPRDSELPNSAWKHLSGNCLDS